MDQKGLRQRFTDNRDAGVDGLGAALRDYDRQIAGELFPGALTRCGNVYPAADKPPQDEKLAAI